MRSRAWSVTLSAILAGLAIAIIQNKVVPCIAVIQESFSIDAGVSGWLSSIFCVMGIAMAFPGAVVVERIGLKRTGLLSILFSIAGTGLGMTARSVPVLMLSRVIEGAGAGLIAIVVPALISQWFEPEQRGLPMSIWSTWQILAQSLCFLFGMSLANALGWQGVWGAGGVVAVAAAILFALFVRSPKEIDPAQESEQAQERVPLLQGLKGRAVWLVCVAMLCFTLGNFGFVTWVATAWSESFGMELDTANRYISVMYLFALPISIAFGFVLNRVNHKRFCVLSYLLYSVISAMAFLLPGRSWILPYIVVYPIVESAVCAAMWTLVPESIRDGRYVAVAMALFGFTQNIGMLLGPPLSGAVLDNFGIAAVAIPVFLPGIIGTGLVACADLNHTPKNC